MNSEGQYSAVFSLLCLPPTTTASQLPLHPDQLKSYKSRSTRIAISPDSFFCFRMSTFPVVLSLLVLYSEAVHFRSFAIMLLLRLPAYIHRCFILHPVPFPVAWIIFNYIAFPSTLLLWSWSADKTKLETFRQQESLKELNKTLTDRLRVVEKSLAFEVGGSAGVVLFLNTLATLVYTNSF